MTHCIAVVTPQALQDAWGAPSQTLLASDCPQSYAWLEAYLAAFETEIIQTESVPNVHLRKHDGYWGVHTPDGAVYPEEPIDRFALFDIAVREALAATRLSAPTLHAAAVVDANDRVWLLCGQSGSGKTTLTTALVGNGLRWLSDEFASFVIYNDGRSCVVDFPRAFELDSWEPIPPQWRPDLTAKAKYIYRDRDGNETESIAFVPKRAIQGCHEIAGLIAIGPCDAPYSFGEISSEKAEKILIANRFTDSISQFATKWNRPNYELFGGTVTQRMEALGSIGVKLSSRV